MTARLISLCTHVIFIVFAVAAAHGVEIRVPQDYLTIQEAINEASDGDEVIVGPGLYKEAISFLGKAITVRSEDPTNLGSVALTAIEAPESRYAVTFENAEGQDSVVTGLTIIGAGGIYCEGSSPTIAANLIINGPGSSRGGIYSSYSSPIIIDNTIIGQEDDGDGSGAGVYCRYSSPVLSRNIIFGNTGGYGDGGVFIRYGESAIITENTIVDNRAQQSGGGVYCEWVDLVTITNNHFSGNSSSSGAAISVESGILQVIGNTIVGNASTGRGGGIVYRSILGTISDNVIEGNSAEASGGGLFCSGTNGLVVVERNRIANNTTNGTGGGLHVWKSSPAIRQNIISGNEAQNGGGVYLERCTAEITGNLIQHNSAEVSGGGILSRGPASTVNNNAIVGNVAGEDGGGISCQDEGAAALRNNTIALNQAARGGGIHSSSHYVTAVSNCILWGNEAGAGAQLSIEWPATVRVSYSDVEGRALAVHAGDGGNLDWDAGNLDAEPHFASDDDFTLADASPCIDAGDPHYGPQPGETDLAGNPRVSRGRIDIGAYEFQGSRTMYVDDDAEGDPAPGDTAAGDPDEDGSPDHPFDAIQEALDAAGDTDAIVVRDGTYNGVGNRDIDFRGKAVALRSENGPESCIIDCGGSTEEYHRGFHFRSGEGAGSIVEGFTIMGAYAGYGAAISCDHSSPQILNNVITGNWAFWRGAGIWATSSAPIISGNAFVSNTVEQGDTAISLTLCSGEVTGNVIADNTAIEGGRAAACYYSSTVISENIFADNTGQRNPVGLYCYEEPACTVVDNVFTGEQSRGLDVFMSSALVMGNVITGCFARGNGAGLHIYGFQPGLPCPTVVGNLITDNRSESFGGGIRCVDDSSTVLVNNIISGNSASRGGGAVVFQRSGAILLNNTITGNSAPAGGGLSAVSDSDIQLANCILWGNAAEQGREISMDADSSVAVHHCDVAGGRDQVRVAEGGILDWGEGNIDADPLFVDPAVPDDEETKTIIAGFRLLPGSPCIDAGANLDGLPDTDILGLPRILDGNRDGVPVADIGAHEYLYGDATGDSKVDILDLLAVRNALGSDSLSVSAVKAADINADGRVDVLDLLCVRSQLR